MIVIAALLAGAILGDWRARRAGGDRRDRVHYIAVHAVIFAILGLAATVILDRALRG